MVKYLPDCFPDYITQSFIGQAFFLIFLLSLPVCIFASASFSSVSVQVFTPYREQVYVSLPVSDNSLSGIRNHQYVSPQPAVSTLTEPSGIVANSPVIQVVVISHSTVISLINQIFGSYAAGAIHVAMCESGLNSNAYNGSGASGLFQIMPGTWVRTAQAGQSPFNASANIAAAYQIFVRDGYSWREWTCKP